MTPKSFIFFINFGQNIIIMQHLEILKHPLLKPYIEKRNYYRKWSRTHKMNYWLFVIIQTVLGLGLAIYLIIYKNNEYTTFFAITLNFTLLVSQYTQFGNKYKRYRVSEQKIEFALLDFCNKYLAQGGNLDDYIKNNILQLGDTIKEITMNEFIDYFSSLKNISDFSATSSLSEGIK